MDDVPATVFQPEDGDGEYAIVIDQIYDAIVLRDVLKRMAQDRFNKAAKATMRGARTKNLNDGRILAKYAERCEEIRLLEAERIGRKLGTVTSQD